MKKLLKMICLAIFLLYSGQTFGSVATITVKNRTDKDRLQWVHTTIPFPKGQVITEEDLKNYSVDHGVIGWRALKWHFTDGVKDSVALAALKMPVYLAPFQEVTLDVVEEAKPNTLSFQFGPNLTAVIERGNLLLDIAAVAKLKNDPRLYLATFLQNGRVVFDGVQSKSLSWHTNFMMFVRAPWAMRRASAASEG